MGLEVIVEMTGTEDVRVSRRRSTYLNQDNISVVLVGRDYQVSIEGEAERVKDLINRIGVHIGIREALTNDDDDNTVDSGGTGHGADDGRTPRGLFRLREAGRLPGADAEDSGRPGAGPLNDVRAMPGVGGRASDRMEVPQPIHTVGTDEQGRGPGSPGPFTQDAIAHAIEETSRLEETGSQQSRLEHTPRD